MWYWDFLSVLTGVSQLPSSDIYKILGIAALPNLSQCTLQTIAQIISSQYYYTPF